MDYHGRAGACDTLFYVLQRLAERRGGMVDPDLVLAPSAFGDERPPLPLAIHRRLVPALSFTPRDLPDMPALPARCYSLLQVPGPPPLPRR